MKPVPLEPCEGDFILLWVVRNAFGTAVELYQLDPTRTSGPATSADYPEGAYRYTDSSLPGDVLLPARDVIRIPQRQET